MPATNNAVATSTQAISTNSCCMMLFAPMCRRICQPAALTLTWQSRAQARHWVRRCHQTCYRTRREIDQVLESVPSNVRDTIDGSRPALRLASSSLTAHAKWAIPMPDQGRCLHWLEKSLKNPRGEGSEHPRWLMRSVNQAGVLVKRSWLWEYVANVREVDGQCHTVASQMTHRGIRRRVRRRRPEGALARLPMGRAWNHCAASSDFTSAYGRIGPVSILPASIWPSLRPLQEGTGTGFSDRRPPSSSLPLGEG